MRNHFVPQAYLREWAKDSEYIVAYPTKPGAAFIRPNTKNIGQETGLYPDDLEKALNREIEMPMTPIIQRVNAGGSLKESEKQIVANYFRSLIDRSPMARQLVAQRVPEASAEIRQELDAALNNQLVADVDTIVTERQRAAIAEACQKAGATPSDAIWHMAIKPGHESAATKMIASMNMAVFSAPPTKHFFYERPPSNAATEWDLRGPRRFLAAPRSSKIIGYIHGFNSELYNDESRRLNYQHASFRRGGPMGHHFAGRVMDS